MDINVLTRTFEGHSRDMRMSAKCPNSDICVPRRTFDGHLNVRQMSVKCPSRDKIVSIECQKLSCFFNLNIVRRSTLHNIQLLDDSQMSCPIKICDANYAT